nr:hypothetical protein Iba_chr06dCG10330 [Ipomoea batatas]
MRISFCQDELHSLRVDKRNKTKHPLLLIWNPNIMHRPIYTTSIIRNILFTKCAISWKSQVNLAQTSIRVKITWHLWWGAMPKSLQLLTYHKWSCCQSAMQQNTITHNGVGVVESEGIVKPLVLKAMGFHTQKVVERRVLFGRRMQKLARRIKHAIVGITGEFKLVLVVVRFLRPVEKPEVIDGERNVGIRPRRQRRGRMKLKGGNRDSQGRLGKRRRRRRRKSQASLDLGDEREENSVRAVC